MDSSLKPSVEGAVLRLLDPLVALLLDSGVGVGDLLSLVKVAYVQAAERRGGEDGVAGPRNVSRIAVVTGLTRGEVKTILASGESKTRGDARQGQRAERVLSGWWADAEFQDERGAPAVLPKYGATRSFAALCRRYSGERRTAPVLDELLRVRAIRELPEQRVQAISRTYATVRWDPEGIANLGEQLREHCATLANNLKHPARARLVRRVANARLNPRYAPMLIRDIEATLRVQADSLDDRLTDPLYVAKSEEEAMCLGVGIYVFESSAGPERAVGPPGRASLESARKRAGKRRGRR